MDGSGPSGSSSGPSSSGRSRQSGSSGGASGGNNSSSRGSGSSRGSALLLDRLGLDREPPTWLISPSRLIIDSGKRGRFVLLGKGAFGHVYRGRLMPPLEPPTAAAGIDGGEGSSPPARVALKVMGAVNASAFVREVEVMQRLSGGCPHVVAIHGACIVEDNLVVVMELVEVRHRGGVGVGG